MAVDCLNCVTSHCSNEIDFLFSTDIYKYISAVALSPRCTHPNVFYVALSVRWPEGETGVAIRPFALLQRGQKLRELVLLVEAPVALVQGRHLDKLVSVFKVLLREGLVPDGGRC